MKKKFQVKLPKHFDKSTVRLVASLAVVVVAGAYVFYDYRLNPNTDSHAYVVTSCPPSATSANSPATPSPCGTCKVDGVLPPAVDGNGTSAEAAGTAALKPLDSQVKSFGKEVLDYSQGTFSSSLNQWINTNSQNGTVSNSALSSWVTDQFNSKFGTEATAIGTSARDSALNSASQALFNKDFNTLGLEYHGTKKHSGSFSGFGTDAESVTWGSSIKNLANITASVDFNYTILTDRLTIDAGYDCQTNLGTANGGLSLNGKAHANLTLSFGSYGKVVISFIKGNSIGGKSIAATWQFGG